MSDYLNLWRDAFAESDWFLRFLARVQILCLHSAIILVLIALVSVFHAR